MSEIINVQKAKTHLSRYLEEVANGAEIILGKHSKPIAKLVPYEEPKPSRKLGGVTGYIAEDCWNTDAEIEASFYESGVEETTSSVAATSETSYRDA